MSEEILKKELIAQTFLKFFLKHGMVQTIIDDVAKELHMSKKTFYKYFRGGKEECLFYLFKNIAAESVKKMEKDLSHLTKPQEKVVTVLTYIYELAVPYVLGNAATKEKDYLLEHQIVRESFRVVFQESLMNILREGVEMGEFHVNDLDLIFRFIYGIFSESMLVIHQYPKRNLINEITSIVLKILE